MSLTVFLAICILGCDLLIYFLYEWAFGESNRIRKGREQSRPTSSAEAHRLDEQHVSTTRVVEMRRRYRRPAVAWPRPNAHQEQLAYRRLAASYAPIKRRA